MSVCPTVRMEQLGSLLDGFSWNLIFQYFVKKNCRKKLKFHWHLAITRGTLHEDLFTFRIIPRSMFQTRAVPKIKTRVLGPNIFVFRKSCLLRNTGKKYCRSRWDTADNTIRCMCFACHRRRQTDRQTHTHTQNMYYSLLFRGNNGNTNALRCYVISTFPTLLNAELNHICPLLALFGAHHILHVSR